MPPPVTPIHSSPLPRSLSSPARVALLPSFAYFSTGQGRGDAAPEREGVA
jgi:hypothetical protein